MKLHPFTYGIKPGLLVSSLLLSPLLLSNCKGVYHSLYEFQANSIRKELQKIPGVEVQNVWGSEELMGLDEIFAEVRINEKGLIRFYNVSKKDFTKADVIHITRIDGSQFSGTGCRKGRDGVWRFTHGLDLEIGTGGALQSLIPFQVETIQDVIRNYDPLNQLVKSWPRCPKWIRVMNQEEEYHFTVISEASTDCKEVIETMKQKELWIGRSFQKCSSREGIAISSLNPVSFEAESTLDRKRNMLQH